MTSALERTAQSPAAVAFCSHLRDPRSGVDVEALIAGVRIACPDVPVTETAGLCELRTLPERASGLVLGVCRELLLTPRDEARLRDAGYDPLGVRLVNLAGWWDDANSRSARTAVAVLLIAGAVAWVRAFERSRPTQLRPRLGRMEGKMSRRSMFRLPAVRYQPVASVCAERCVASLGCALCVEACPARALTTDGTWLHLDPGRCTACGLCAAACPRAAIDLPAPSRTQIEAELDALLRTPAPAISRRIIVFSCPHGATTLRQRGSRNEPATAWLRVEVPSIDVVSVEWLLGSLALGAVSAVVVSCPGGCPPEQGDSVSGRIDYCRALLRQLGHLEERIALLDVADVQRLDDAVAAAFTVAPAQQSGGQSFAFGGADTSARALLALVGETRAGAFEPLSHRSSPLGMVFVDSGVCTMCERCTQVCPTGALQMERLDDGVALAFDPARCVACGLCPTQCPEAGAIRVDRVTDLPALMAGRRQLVSGNTVRCTQCGGPIAPMALLRRIATLVESGDDSGAELLRNISQRCPSCRVVGSPAHPLI